MKMRKIDIREIEGFRLGNAENVEAGTGVTVVISEEGAVAGVDVRGGGPATRETDLLKSENTVDKVHAVVLSGGSAFGLEAGSGVMRALAEKGIGFQVDEGIVVPIVPGASLYDLTVGRSDVFPDVEMGREAVASAYRGDFSTGNHGAGTGTTVGKYLGYSRAMKTGLGTFACGDDFVQVGAIAAVNAVGDIYNGAGNIIAGLRTTDGTAIKGTIRVLKGMVHDESSPDLDLSDIRTIAASESVKKTSAEPKSPFVSEETGSSVKESAAVSEEPSADEKDDIVRAMMRSYEQENSSEAVQEPASVTEPSAADDQTATDFNQLLQSQAAKAQPAAYEEPAANTEPEEQPAVSAAEEPDAALESAEDPEIADEYLSLDTELTEAEQTAAAPEDPEEYVSKYAAPEHFEVQTPVPPEYQAYEEEITETAPEQAPADVSVSDEGVTESSHEEVPESASDDKPSIDDEYVLTDEDRADMGYDIPFNTTISVVITNAAMTKSQANKLAQILHDAYARAIKPVHSTLDGDTVFVMSTCTQKVNFDAFAALATDVLQYAIIDGAASAEGAYGLPAARDIIHR